MSRSERALLATSLCLLAAFAVWRIGTDALGMREAGQSLAARTVLPLGSATHALGQHASSSAGSSAARALLAVEPLQGRAFATLAADAAPSDRARMYDIAERRAPRLVLPRVWLANNDLQSGRYAEALREIDVLLRLKPPYRPHLYPLLRGLGADDPAFADALAAELRRMPSWRAEFIGTLVADGAAGKGSVLMAHLASAGVLKPEELDRSIDRLIQQERWGDAYAQWAGSLAPLPSRLRAVYNGGFDAPPTDRGFDWRTMDIPSGHVEFAAVPGASGLAAHVEFPGSAAAGAGLEHPLFLSPGRYRLLVQMRAVSLQGLSGLKWTIACGDRSNAVARGAAVRGSFDWRAERMDFVVPAHGCSGQWLQLANPAPVGAAQAMSGEVWFDDVSINALEVANTKPVARLVAASVVLLSKGADFVATKPGTILASGDRVIGVGGSIRVAYGGGCTQTLADGAVHTIDEAGCGRVPSLRARATVPTIEVLPEAETWPLPPVGR